MDVKIRAEWKELLQPEFEKPYFAQLREALHRYRQEGAQMYPPGGLIFNAFELTAPRDVRVVILGQDPYHNPGEAMGLCFSVPKHVRIPPSLKNIYKELYDDLKIMPPNHGDLTEWGRRGVFLLNSVLTVGHNQPASHQKIGWQQFTDRVIEIISDVNECVVFLLWGNYARTKQTLVNIDKHLVVIAAHPSPLARGAFFGHRPFSTANKYLEAQGLEPVDWKL